MALTMQQHDPSSHLATQDMHMTNRPTISTAPYVAVSVDMHSNMPLPRTNVLLFLLLPNLLP